MDWLKIILSCAGKLPLSSGFFSNLDGSMFSQASIKVKSFSIWILAAPPASHSHWGHLHYANTGSGPGQ